MLKKTHALALTVATAGLLGFAAPMASAATMSHHPEIVNVSNNQVPIEACGNDAYGNIFGGQVPAEGDAVVASLLSPGSVTKAKAVNNRGCKMDNNESNRHDDEGGLVKATGNQVPVEACGNDLLLNGAGGQVPLYGLDGALSVLSAGSITKSTAVNNQGCTSHNNESNGHKAQHMPVKHKKPCKKK
ncbi:MAG TPA: hypothetical protein VHT26_00470 [Trebonia sp.]|jgi:hypothetical protein|nr:hypothetical protein [Trebonia sp.]